MTEPIDDTSTGKLMEGVLAAFAQFDNDVRSERTRAGMRMALEQGRWMFIPPVGYLNAPKWTGKSLMPDPDRAALVTRAFEEFATGVVDGERELSWPDAAGHTHTRHWHDTWTLQDRGIEWPVEHSASQSQKTDNQRSAPGAPRSRRAAA